MNKIYDPNGIIRFVCKCGRVDMGTDEDTLVAEIDPVDTDKSIVKYAAIIDHASFDEARNIVHRRCPSCFVDILTMIRIGSNETTMYTCSCGYRATHERYMEQIATAANTSR